MQNFSHLFQGKHFQIRDGIKWVGKCAYLTENWPYFGNGERYGLGYINH